VHSSAQMRCQTHGIQEVVGSTPIGSIEFRGLTVLGCEAVAAIATTSPVPGSREASAAASLRSRCHYVPPTTTVTGFHRDSGRVAW
jgi:hypothetical protein